VFVRDRARVERTALGIVGGQNEVVEAVQEEASPTPLPGEPPKAKNLLPFSILYRLQARFQKTSFCCSGRASLLPRLSRVIIAAHHHKIPVNYFGRRNFGRQI
jgi:hypothetical protein